MTTEASAPVEVKLNPCAETACAMWTNPSKTAAEDAAFMEGFRAALAQQTEARGVVDDTVQIERHYAENIHYAAIVLAQSKSPIDRREAVVLQGIVSRMREFRNGR
jgi:hypothetical protein